MTVEELLPLKVYPFPIRCLDMLKRTFPKSKLESKYTVLTVLIWFIASDRLQNSN